MTACFKAGGDFRRRMTERYTWVTGFSPAQSVAVLAFRAEGSGFPQIEVIPD